MRASASTENRFIGRRRRGNANVAVLEKGWIGGGNTGRNTTIVRSNYLWDDAAALYEKSLRLFEGLSRALNFNVMFSQRGVFNLGHSVHEMRDIARRVNANRLNGIDGRLVGPDELARLVPILDVSARCRYPVLGASFQPRGGVARHDAVAWGFARAADALGVDVIQNCEVTGIRRERGRVAGVETTRGYIRARRVGLVAAGHSSVLASMADVRLPIESHPLQALVSEPMKPVLDTVVMSNAVHAYVSQSDKGELVVGAGIDPWNGYGQRGSFGTVEGALAAIVEMFPIFSRVRMLRHWAGIVDTTPDACPIIGETPVRGALRELRLGHGRLQGHPGLGLGARAHDRDRRAPSPQRAVRPEPLRDRAPRRRARRGGGRPLARPGRGPDRVRTRTDGRRAALPETERRRYGPGFERSAPCC